MNRDELFLMRRKKGITLKMIANYVNCSVSMLSLWENEKANLDPQKQILYKEFIQNYK